MMSESMIEPPKPFDWGRFHKEYARYRKTQTRIGKAVP